MNNFWKFLIGLVLLIIAFCIYKCNESSDGGCDLSAPAEVNANNVTATSAIISWTEVVGAKGYGLTLKDSALQTTLIDTFTGASEFTILNLEPNTTYQAEVKSACDENLVSPNLSVVFFTTSIIIGDDVVMNPVGGESDGLDSCTCMVNGNTTFNISQNGEKFIIDDLAKSIQPGKRRVYKITIAPENVMLKIAFDPTCGILFAKDCQNDSGGNPMKKSSNGKEVDVSVVGTSGVLYKVYAIRTPGTAPLSDRQLIIERIQPKQASFNVTIEECMSSDGEWEAGCS